MRIIITKRIENTKQDTLLLKITRYHSHLKTHENL